MFNVRVTLVHFVLQTWMSAQMGRTSATTTQSVTTHWVHTAAHARRDSREMVSSAQVTHTRTYIHTCFKLKPAVFNLTVSDCV